MCVFAAATSMKWIDAKMEELGMLSNPNFKISMVMDDLAMITVDTPTYGVIEACSSSTFFFIEVSMMQYVCLDDPM